MDCPRLPPLQDWAFCGAVAGRAHPSRSPEVSCPSHRPGSGHPPEREPETASQGASPQPQVLHCLMFSGPGVSPGWVARGAPHVEGGVPGGPIVLEPHQPLVLGLDPGAAGCTVSVAGKAFPRCAGHGRWRHGMRGAGAQRARHRVTGHSRSQSPRNEKLPPSPCPPRPSCPLHWHSWQQRSSPAGPRFPARPAAPPPRAPHCLGSGGRERKTE